MTNKKVTTDNFNGTIYNSTSQITGEAEYFGYVFDDTKITVYRLSSNKLDTIIKMAETFKIT